MDLGKFVVVKDGVIDVEASVTKFRNAVTIAAETRKNDLEVVAVNVAAVYDQYPGAYIQIDALKSFVLRRLDVSPAAYSEIAERVHKYVQENTEAGNGITEAGTPALFVLKKGKGGGFARRADLRAKEAAAPQA